MVISSDQAPKRLHVEQDRNGRLPSMIVIDWTVSTTPTRCSSEPINTRKTPTQEQKGRDENDGVDSTRRRRRDMPGWVPP